MQYPLRPGGGEAEAEAAEVRGFELVDKADYKSCIVDHVAGNRH